LECAVFRRFRWTRSNRFDIAQTKSAGIRRTPNASRGSEPQPKRGTHHASRFTQYAKRSTPAFTLIEVLLALGIFSLVLVAINTAFFAAIRLRQRTSEVLDQSLPLNQSLTLLRRDLQNAVPPGGVLAGDFNSDGPSGTQVGGLSKAKRMGSGQTGGLDFFTSTGALSDTAPWGDLQEVNYQLKEPENRSQFYGRDLVRSVTRNLLATSTQATEEQRLLNNVESLEFLYFDGSQWRDSWNTSAGDTGLPAAVRVRIQMASSDGPTPRTVQPLEMVVLVETKAGTNQTATATATGGGQ
jgi:type II secretion system protein J